MQALGLPAARDTVIELTSDMPQRASVHEFPRAAPIGWACAAALAAAYAASAQQFVDQTAVRFPVQAEYTNYIAVGDIDGDGDLDICFANGGGYSTLGALLKPRIYVNNGSGVFADETDARAAGITGCFRSAEFGDVDGDGDLDLVLAQDFNRPAKLLINDGTGTFADQSAARIPSGGLSSARATLGDVDGDGDLDIALCNSGTSSRFGSNGQPRLWINSGSGVFADETAARLPAGNIPQQMDILLFDADGDLDLDLFVVTRATSPGQSRLWRNDGTGRFTGGVTFPNDASAYAYDAGDIDGDGDLDLIGVNAGTSNRELLARNANGIGTSWTDISSSISPNPTTDDNDSKFIDIDDDGDLDLVIAVLGSSKRVYRNSGAGAFTQVTGAITASTDSSLDIKVGDFDGDGRYDLVTGQGESGQFQNRIYMNTGAVDTRPPTIAITEQVVPGTEAGVPRPVRVAVRDAYTSHMGFHARSVTLRHGTGGTLDGSVAMTLSGNGIWRGVLPARPAGSIVSYSVRATDAAGNTADGPVLTYTEPGDAGSPADLNGDGEVDGIDLTILLAAYGSGDTVADINDDGIVDGFDLAALLAAFGS
jgi:hypothetical protein